MLVDFHCHSNFSDGTLSPAQLIARAEAAGVTHLSITDHDTVNAYRQNLQPATLKLVPGVEFSTQWRGIGVHIVGLNIEPDHHTMAEATNQQTEARLHRAELIAKKLEKLGIPQPLQGAREFSGCDFIGRPHFAQYLVACGAVKTVAEAFKKYLGKGKAGDIKQLWAEMDTVIGWILESGGVAVLAHPLKYQLTGSKLRSLLDDFITAGGRAMEVISGQQTLQQTREMARLCNAKKLLASSGSDFHQPQQPWAALGKQPKLPESCTPVWGNGEEN